MIKKLWLCSVLTSFFCIVSFAQNKQFTVTAYYAADTSQINRYDARKLTHIIFSFCHLKGNRLSVDNKMDTLTINKLAQLKKQNPSLKVLLSLGGWGGCATYSDVFSTADGRKEFAASVKELNDYFRTDGIDLDWEYPAIEGHPGHKYQLQDKQNFTELIVELRKSLGTENEISFAAGGFQKFIDEAVEWQKIIQHIDRVNVMTYDLVSGYATITGHHTPLYSTVQQKESTGNAVQALLKAGVPANKLVIGAAFYGRMWENVADTNNGLYQPAKFKTSIAYKNFEKQLSKEKGFTYFWDEVAKAPYLYNSKQKLFVTYDDKRSMDLKTKYAVQNGLNGIMFWELSQDLSNNGLLDAIDKARR